MNDDIYNSEYVAKNEAHIRNTYLDKACRLLKISIVLAILVFIDYLLNMGEYERYQKTYLSYLF